MSVVTPIKNAKPTCWTTHTHTHTHTPRSLILWTLSCTKRGRTYCNNSYDTWLVWCGFYRASSLICGNKMPSRCNRWFLLQILLLAQHVSGTIMTIIRSSRVLYKWLVPVVFGALVSKLSLWCGAEGYVSGCSPQTGHTTLSYTPYRQLENQSTKYDRQQPLV